MGAAPLASTPQDSTAPLASTGLQKQRTVQEFGWRVPGPRQEEGALEVHPTAALSGPLSPTGCGSCPQREGKYKKRKVHQSTCPAPGDPPVEGHRWQWLGRGSPRRVPCSPSPSQRQRHGVCSAFGRFGGHCWGTWRGGQAPGTRTLGHSTPFATLSAPCKTNVCPHPEQGAETLSCSNGGGPTAPALSHVGTM